MMRSRATVQSINKRLTHSSNALFLGPTSRLICIPSSTLMMMALPTQTKRRIHTQITHIQTNPQISLTSTSISTFTPLASSFTSTYSILPTQTASFSSQSGGGGSGGRKNNSKEKQPLTNDALLKVLQRRFKSQGDIHQMEVRVVTDVGKKESPPEVTIQPLGEAYEHAKQLKLDLIEIDLKQTPPVLRAADYGKMMYQLKKKTKAVQASGGGTKQLATKEYKFKAGISQHDLERKVQNMESYLQKGHSCKVTITARYFLVNQNNNIAMETLERVQERLKDSISESTTSGKIRQSNAKHLSVLLQPKKQ